MLECILQRATIASWSIWFKCVCVCVCVCVCMWARMCVSVSPSFEIFSAYILSFLLNQREEERLHGVDKHLSIPKITKMCVTLVDNCDFLQKWFHALFYFKPRGLQDLSSPTRDRTYALGSEGRVLTYGLPGNSPEAILNQSSLQRDTFEPLPLHDRRYVSLLGFRATEKEKTGINSLPFWESLQ